MNCRVTPLSEDPIVISGISGRYPQADDVDELWAKIVQGIVLYERDATPYPKIFSKLPKSRGSIKDPTRFDNQFFGISNQEANSMDAQIRILHEVTFESLWDAGIIPSTWKGKKTGLFLGSFADDTDRTFKAQYDAVATRLAYTYDFKGPTVRVDTACASSLSALHLAMLSIQAGDCSQAIVAGVCVHQKPFLSPGFIQHGLLSSSGGSWCLDERADGFVRAEAVVAAVVQRKSQAKRIYAEVISCASNTDGYTPEGLMFPRKEAQRAAMKDALSQSNIAPSQINYVEAHMTGTQAGDRTECSAILEAYRENSNKKIVIGTLKANIGHTEASAGLSSLTKVAKIFQKRLLPPNINLEKPNPLITGLISGQIVTLSQPKEFLDDILCVDSFGFGGANCHLILKANTKSPQSDHKPPLLLLCNRTEEGLVKMHSVIQSDPQYSKAWPLLMENSKIPPESGMIYRSYLLTTSDGQSNLSQISQIAEKEKLCLVFGRPLEKFPNELHDLAMNTEVCRSLEKSLGSVLQKQDREQLIATIQMVKFLQFVDLNPDFIVGQSLGSNFAKLYAQVLDLKEAVNGSIHQLRSKNCWKNLMEKIDVDKLLKSYGSKNHSNSSSQEFLLRKSLPLSELKSSNFLVLDRRIYLVRKEGEQLKTAEFESIWKLLGSLYLTGQNLSIEKLLPTFNFPVSRDCPCLSPLLEWKYDEKFRVNWYPDFFNPSNQTHHQIDLMDPEFSNIQDHKIDGLTLIPGAIYLYLIAKHLGQLHFGGEVKVGSFSFHVWDIHFEKALHIDEEVTLVISQDPATKAFVAQSQGEVYARGFAELAPKHFPDLVPSIFTLDSEEIVLDHRELYQYMKIRGYDFQRNFKLLDRMKVAKRSQAIVKQSDDLIAFFDALIQSDQVWTLSKALKVPISIAEFNFDAQAFHQRKEDNPDAEMQDWVIQSDYEGQIYTNGISFLGIKWRNLRRNFEQDKVRYAQLIFTLYHENFQFPLDLAKSRSEYVQACHQLIEDVAKKQKSSEGVGEAEKSKVLLSMLMETRNTTDMLKNLFNSQKLPLFDDLLLDFPISFLDSVLDIVNENWKKDGLEIGLVGVLPNNLQKAIERRCFLWQKWCTIDKFPGQSAGQSRVSNYDLVVIVDESMGLFPKKEDGHEGRKVDERIAESSKDGSFLLLVGRLAPHQIESFTAKKLAYELSEFDGFEKRKSFFLDKGLLQVSKYFIKDLNAEILLLRKPFEASPIKHLAAFTFEQENDFTWVDQLQTALYDDQIKRVWLISRNSCESGIIGLVRCLRLEPCGEKVRCVFVMDSESNIEQKLWEAEFKQLQKLDLVQNVKKHGQWGHFIVSDLNFESELVTESCHYELEIGRAGNLTSLRWIESGTKWISEDQLIEIKAAAINFKDVLIANGVVPSDAYPNERVYGIGHEFCGITADGRRVMGLITSGAFASRVRASEAKFLLPVPEDWTDAQAATIPLCYLTVYYALPVRAKLRPGETVLIHAGSGGVGLAAISLCLTRKCRVFVTVSTEEKRKFVQKEFPQLADSCFADSRSVEFEEFILRETNGRGVDIILNSLSGEKINAGLRCLVENGRFIEIGKRDILEDKKIDRNDMKESIAFETVCIGFLTASADEPRMGKMMERLVEMMSNGLKVGEVRPLPLELFAPTAVEKAFRHMLRGAHKGKLVLDIGRHPKILCLKRTYFHSQKSYCVVGGLGGMGLEFIEWMALRGAEKIIVCSRSEVKTNYQKFALMSLKQRHPHLELVVVRSDLTTLRGTQRCIKECNRLAPVGGVFNLATVLIDGLFQNQTRENFEVVCASKIRITRNLDTTTRKECPQLDHFVCFSSIASNGNMGQSNYGLGNSFMERICEKRRAEGLPGLAIQWGPVADVGVAARRFKGDTRTVIGGYESQRIRSCLDSLDVFMTSSYPVGFSAIPAEKKAMNTSDILIRIGRILGIKELRSVDENKSLRELGMDSVQLLEVQHFLNQEKGLELSSLAVADLTLKDLKATQHKQSGEKSKSKMFDQSSAILVRLNDKINDPLFFFPPGIHDFLSMKDLAYSLDRAVIGVDVPTSLINESVDFSKITEKLYEQIISNFPNLKKYYFLGYSMGVLTSFDVARKIQTRLGQDRIDKIIFIDNSPWGNVTTIKVAKSLEDKVDWNKLKESRNPWGMEITVAERRRLMKTVEDVSDELDSLKNWHKFFTNNKSIKANLDVNFDVKFKGDVLVYKATNILLPFMKRMTDNMEKTTDGKIIFQEIDSNHFQIVQHGLQQIRQGVIDFFPYSGEVL